MDNELITLATHTYEKAIILKSILEAEGIEATLQNVNLVQPVVSSGVRVRIRRADLPKALRIIESADSLQSPDSATEDTAKVNRIPVVLVPVDFSSHSDKACRVAFDYASCIGAEVLLLHAFISPGLAPGFQLTNSLDFDFDNLSADELGQDIEEAAKDRLDKYSAELRSRMEKGELPPARFTTKVVDDVAEDAICEAARAVNPKLIIMGTRGSGRKEIDMIGSVTAEVLAESRQPVFTVPDESKSTCSLTHGEHILLFTSFEQTDLLALDLMYSLLPEKAYEVTLVSMPSKRPSGQPSQQAIDDVMEYASTNLPRFNISVHPTKLNDLEAEYAEIISSETIDFIAIPSRRRNIFMRLFNPGLAHKLLFQADVPMLILPI